jgi:DNA invertase Pin-like site-specific DNA recombinase
MGRLTPNILLSFAQFEREVIGERIRDKFAASRKRGMGMGGWPPLGYDTAEPKEVMGRRPVVGLVIQLPTNSIVDIEVDRLNHHGGPLEGRISANMGRILKVHNHSFGVGSILPL